MNFASNTHACAAAGLIAAASLGLAGFASAQPAGGHALAATMTGPAETPPGDPHGTGTAALQVDLAKGQVCYDLKVGNIATPTMAHIHKGAPGQAGPVVVPLKAPGDTGVSSGCAKADDKVLSDIVQNPSAYYVNVHNAQFPGGAVRGQLSQ